MIIQATSGFSSSEDISINGLQKPYITTSDLSKGDFVQLTTKGVEDLIFTEISSFSNTANGKNGVGLCVLSESLILYTYAEYAAWGSAGECNVYAQAASYKGGSWVTGQKILVHTKTGAYCDVDVTRLDNSSAALCFGCRAGTSSSSASTCSFFILTIDADGEISIAASSIDSLAIGNILYAPVRAVGVTNSSFVVLTPSSSYGGLGVVACSYSNGTLSHTASVLQIYAGTSTNDYGLVHACKLNDNAVLISHNSGSSSTSSLKAPVILHIFGTSIQKEDASTTLYFGPMCRVSDNTIVQLPYAKSKAMQLLTYDVDSGQLSKADILTAGAYYHFEMVQLSDDKFCALVSTGTNPQNTNLGLVIIDTATLSYTYLGTRISGAATGSNYSTHLADSYAGWMGVINGHTSALVSPSVSETTASNYISRIDGIALSDTAAGEIAFVAVPE